MKSSLIQNKYSGCYNRIYLLVCCALLTTTVMAANTQNEQAPMAPPPNPSLDIQMAPKTSQDEVRSGLPAKKSKPVLSKGETIMIGKLDFRQSRVSDIIRALADVSGMNIVATEEASKKEISLFLQEVSVKDAIELMSKSAGLWYRQDKNSNSFRIMTTGEYQGDLIIYRDDVTKVFDILHPNPVIIANAIRDLYGNRVILSLGVEDDTTMGTFGAAGAATATTRNIGGNTSGLNSTRQNNNRQNNNRGGGGGVSNENMNQVEFTEKLSSEKLARLDANMEEQIGGKSNTGEAAKEFAQKEQPIYVTLNREHSLVMVRTSDALAVRDIEQLIKQMDRPTQQVLLEMKILSLDVGDAYRQSFDLDYVPNDEPVSGPPTDQDRNPLSTTLPGVRNILGLGNFALEGGTFVYQFMNDKIRARIQLLQEDSKINTLSSPILLATNNKPARVFVGAEQVITTGFDAVAGGSNGLVVGAPAIIPVTEIRNIGNTLQIMPKINADNTVTLLIQQDSSSLLRGASSIPVPVGPNIQNFNVDSVRTSNIQGTVVAKNGLTVAIGGLIDTTESEEEQKVPFLGDVPLIGELFKRIVKEKGKRELLLLITPHIINTPQDAEDTTRDAIEPRITQEW